MPFHLTTVAPAPGRKLEPLTVSVKDALLFSAEVGLMLVMVGRDELMVKIALLEVPAEELTETLAAPGAAIRLAGTAAVSWVALM